MPKVDYACYNFKQCSGGGSPVEWRGVYFRVSGVEGRLFPSEWSGGLFPSEWRSV